MLLYTKKINANIDIVSCFYWNFDLKFVRATYEPSMSTTYNSENEQEKNIFPSWHTTPKTPEMKGANKKLWYGLLQTYSGV